MAICLERGADLHTAQLMPLPLTVSCFSKIQIGFTFLVPSHLSSPRQGVIKCACVCKIDHLQIQRSEVLAVHSLYFQRYLLRVCTSAIEVVLWMLL